MIRIGFGYDAHRLVEGHPLFLGGVKIPHRLGLEGHSDADVLTHAIIDAVIGALGMGDIGQHFPDTDPAYKGASSLSMLKTVAGWMKRDGYKLNNLDATIVAESPKMAAHLPMMREKVAKALETHASQINFKATTTEGLGFCGSGEGIEAFAVVSLVNIIAESESD
ncbi:MAG: 2-C-methyl-D-erythritol 2,4-cyclodiphosphate synthase [Desulfobacteraceae bacterium]|nr:MAG: 2-C-methyl-D-erythritol 2,4-cyclodiphosphate synthase [Desulfobacteraceae bacterium]